MKMIRITFALAALSVVSVTQAQQYVISTVAGGGLLPTSSFPASVAIARTAAVATDRQGNLYIGVEYGVLKLDSRGALTVAAGTGGNGDSGDGGPATKA